MQMLSLPQLRLAQLQTLTEGVLQITQNLTEVSAQVEAVKAAYTSFQEGMTKTTAASNKKTLDRTRDQINAGFFNGMEAEALFPYTDPLHKATRDKVVAIAGRYGFELNRLSYDEQTAETDNMITELEALDLSALPIVQRWIEPIKSANDSFKLIVESYLKELTLAGNTEAATKAAIPLEDVLRELFTILHAHTIVTKTEPIIDAYKELTTLINSYK